MTSHHFGDRSHKKNNDSHMILQNEHDFRSGTAINIREPVHRIVQKRQKLFWILLFIVLILLITTYFVLIKTGVAKRAFLNLEFWLRMKYDDNPTLVFFIFYSLVICIMVFSLTGKMIVFVTASLIIKDSFNSFVLLLISTLSGEAIIFLISTYFLRNWVLRKFKDNDFYTILLEESKSEPYKTAFMVRVLLLPNGLKSYILMAIDNSVMSYFLSAFVFHAIFITEAVIIASEFNEIEDFVENENGWSQKSETQKILFVLFWVLLVVAVSTSLFLGVWVKKRLDQKAKQKNEIVGRVWEMN